MDVNRNVYLSNSMLVTIQRSGAQPLLLEDEVEGNKGEGTIFVSLHKKE